VNTLRKTAFSLVILLVLAPTVFAEDSDEDGFDDPSDEFTIWDGADAYPNNPDIHEPVFSTGCDPPVAKLDLSEPVTFTCTVRNEGPIPVNIFVEVEEGAHLSNQFLPSSYAIDSLEVITIKVNLIGHSEGYAKAKVQIFARANGSASHLIELPIEVTNEEWSGLNSQGDSSSTLDISFFSTILDEIASWLSGNTPWEFTNMNAGLLVLLMGFALVTIIRRKRARSTWRRNMQHRPIEDGRREALFDAIRKGSKFQYADENTIPESPVFIIRRNQ